MQNINAIFKKEFRSYFNSPIAYIFITFFLGISSWLFFQTFFLANQAEIREFFGLMPWIFLFFIPAVTMKLWAEEKKLGTAEILMTLPIRDYEVVLGKFLASFGLLAVTALFSLGLPFSVIYLGDPDGGTIVCGYIGLLLMGGAYLAIGLFASTLTENQIIAFILGITICFVLLIIGTDYVLFSTPNWLFPIFSYLGLGAHYSSILRGVIDSRDIIYYLSIIGFFLYLSTLLVESRKWR
ncbi:ABC transporter permease subunit [Candidatus Poribacteria bacterium]|nr:ABC transporter permease subunit [Candidatus Poribacteria bacterium]